jgi:Uma2 family endonuclease
LNNGLEFPKEQAMTQAKPRFLDFDQYLALEDTAELPEGRAEYVDGELIQLPPESRVNLLIARYLSQCLEGIGVPFGIIYTHAFEVEVPQTAQAREQTRYPDVIVLRPVHLSLTRQRATITRDMPPPLLIAEVVSPGEKNQTRDYVAKREQYCLLQVPEYWLIDPGANLVTVLVLAGTTYQVQEFSGADRVLSPTFPRLTLTAEQLLTVGR